MEEATRRNAASLRLWAAVELVALRKALRRQAAGIAAVAAPVGELLERERVDAAGGIGPGQALLRFEYPDEFCAVGFSAVD